MFVEGTQIVARSDAGVIEALDASNARVCAEQRALLRLLVEVDRRELWRDDGARDTAHWLAIRYGISMWKGHRWIAAAYALEHLPAISEAFTSGELGIDKVAELTRFATPADEAKLIRWAAQISVGAIRQRGDLVARASIDEVVEAEQSRSLSWGYVDEGRRFDLQANLPAAEGAIVARELQRVADVIPAMPGEGDELSADARRADALVALCSGRGEADADASRATVVIHAQLEALQSGTGGCEVEGGPVVHPETVRRLLCNARTQTVVEDGGGNVLGLGRMRREPTVWMLRQLRYRDRECRFPGCGARRFTHAHHVRFWRHGGTTDLDNLLLLCSFHHRLVHEHGWSVHRDADGTVRWLLPGGVAYRAGPSPPGRSPDPEDLEGHAREDPTRVAALVSS